MKTPKSHRKPVINPGRFGVWRSRLHLNWTADRRKEKTPTLDTLKYIWPDWPDLRRWLSWPTLSRWRWFRSVRLASGRFTVRSLRFCLRSTEAEARQDLGRGENLGCVYEAWRNEGKWLRISCEVTLTCRPQPRSLQAQHRSTALCHSRSSPFFLKQFIHPQAQAARVFWVRCTSSEKLLKRKKAIGRNGDKLGKATL